MKKIPLCNFDLHDKVTKEAKVQSVVLPKEMKISAHLEVDDQLYAKINDDEKLATDIFTEVSKIFKATVPKLVQQCKSVNGQCVHIGKRNASKKKNLAEQLKSQITKTLTEAGTEMADAGKTEIQKLLAKQKDKTHYTIKSGINLTMGAIALTVGVVGLAAAPFTVGMSLALSLWGFWKGVKGMWDQISSLREDIDKARDGLNKNLQELVEAYRDRSKTMTGVAEAGQSVIQWLLGASGTTIAKCDDGLKAYRNKITQLDSKLRELGKALHKTLDEQQDLQKKIEQLDDQCRQQGVISNELKDSEDALEKMVKATEETIDQLTKLNKQVKDNEDAANEYEQALEQLQAQKPGWASIAEKVIKYGPDLVLSGGSNVLGEEKDLVNFGHDIVQALTDFGADQGLG